jgi:hypothetical protein
MGRIRRKRITKTRLGKKLKVQLPQKEKNGKNELNEQGIRQRREPVAFLSDHMTLAGVQKWGMCWQGHSYYGSPSIAWTSAFTFYKGKSYLDQENSFARSHTLEIAELRRFL